MSRRQGKQPERRRAAEIIAREMDLPTAVFSGMAHIELEGNKEAVVEGCKSVLEYEEGIIRLDLGKNSIRFMGHGLVIRTLSTDKAVIRGTILSIEFIT